MKARSMKRDEEIQCVLGIFGGNWAKALLHSGGAQNLLQERRVGQCLPAHQGVFWRKPESMARPFRCVGSGVMHDIVRVYKVALAWRASYYARYRGQPMLLFACLLWVFHFYYVFLSLFGICGLSGKVTTSKHATAYPSKGCQQKQFMLEIRSCLLEFYAALQDGDNWFALHKNLK